MEITHFVWLCPIKVIHNRSNLSQFSATCPQKVRQRILLFSLSYPNIGRHTGSKLGNPHKEREEALAQVKCKVIWFQHYQSTKTPIVGVLIQSPRWEGDHKGNWQSHDIHVFFPKNTCKQSSWTPSVMIPMDSYLTQSWYFSMSRCWERHDIMMAWQIHHGNHIWQSWKVSIYCEICHTLLFPKHSNHVHLS